MASTRTHFGPVRNLKLREEVVTRLRSAIVLGKLIPGQRLAEEEFSQQLGISRSPVREALVQLEQEGLVVYEPNRGVFVRCFSAKEVRELFSVRAAIETLAAEHALSHLTEADFQAFEELMEKQRIASENGDLIAEATFDLQFHQAIVAAAQHALLLRLWLGLRDQMLMLFSLRLRLDRPKARIWPHANPDHVQLVAALRTNDLEAVQRINREVNLRVAEETCQMIKRLEAALLNRTV